MRSIRFFTYFACLLLTIGWVAPLAAQTATGTITGRITDASGSIVGGASVELTSIDRGVVTTTRSNDAGIYLFPTVQPGDYRLTVEREGFKKAEVARLTVNVGDHIEESFRLEVGSVREAVTVEAGAGLVDTLSSTVSSVVTGAPIEDLPLNGRDTLQLALTQPGVMPSPGAPFGASAGVPSGEFTIAGGRDNAITYLLNGGNNTSVTYGVPVVDPNPDTVAEFRVIENNYSAEYGRSNGGSGQRGDQVRHQPGAWNRVRLSCETPTSTPIISSIRARPGSYQPRPILTTQSVWWNHRRSHYLAESGQRKRPVLLFLRLPGPAAEQRLGGAAGHYLHAGRTDRRFLARGQRRTRPNVVSFLQSHPYFQANPQLAAQGIINPASIDPGGASLHHEQPDSHQPHRHSYAQRSGARQPGRISRENRLQHHGERPAERSRWSDFTIPRTIRSCWPPRRTSRAIRARTSSTTILEPSATPR